MSSSSRKMLQAAAGNAGGDFYPYTIDYSALFNDNDSAYLSWTAGTPTDQNVFTFSFWTKRANLSANMSVFSAGNVAGYARSNLGFESDDQIRLNWDAVSPPNTYVATTAVYRDPSAWMHVVIAVDTDNGTAADRVKIYVNNVRVTDLSGTVYPGSGDAWDFNASGVVHNIGRRLSSTSTWYCDLYLAQVAFVDGQALTPSSFGEDKNNIWCPSNLSGITWGNNGFYLDFSNSAALGTDVSGNGNNWTPSGLTSSDQMTDTPTSNHATWNPLKFRSTSYKAVLAEGNLKATFDDAGFIEYAYGTMAVTSGKWYWEQTCNAVGGEQYIGVVGANVGEGNPSISRFYRNNATKYLDGGSATAYGATWTTGDVMGCDLDMDNGTIEFFKNGTSQGVAYTDLLTAMPDGGWAIMAGGYNNSACTIHTSSDKWTYTPSTDFVAMSTANLPEPTIGPNSDILTSEVFASILYTGNGTSQSISTLDFQPDFTWIKNRDALDNHMLFDAVRGATKYLSSNSASVEATDAQSLSSFNSNGFSVGSNVAVNTNAEDYVAWNWKGNGSGVTNTDGSITSTVSANTDAGISIVTYTGNATNSTVGHGLNSAPEVVIVKARARSGGSDWPIMFQAANSGNGQNGWIRLNLNAAWSSTSILWNNTSPTSSVFTIGTYDYVNDNGTSHVAYCFHSVEGFSKFGSYTGNGSADGSYIWTGFRPAWVVIKRTDATSDWVLWDEKRDPYNYMGRELQPDKPDAELARSEDLDFLSNGFKLRRSGTNFNGSGASYIYMAFAEMPFKYSVGR
jgi:hypothetical protein